ncbi:hypothetical protein NRB56_23160 [Nocardia sp. RB56]|uniref:Uncharacterized protein n=1 Tax=Nocardia aurantia TaxID=2585199 RepID=A0A7K0DLV0_9NOCA|nr:hypothetical protein [Nocardia aurantia]
MPPNDAFRSRCPSNRTAHPRAIRWYPASYLEVERGHVVEHQRRRAQPGMRSSSRVNPADFRLEAEVHPQLPRVTGTGRRRASFPSRRRVMARRWPKPTLVCGKRSARLIRQPHSGDTFFRHSADAATRPDPAERPRRQGVGQRIVSRHSLSRCRCTAAGGQSCGLTLPGFWVGSSPQSNSGAGGPHRLGSANETGLVPKRPCRKVASSVARCRTVRRGHRSPAVPTRGWPGQCRHRVPRPLAVGLAGVTRNTLVTN